MDHDENSFPTLVPSPGQAVDLAQLARQYGCTRFVLELDGTVRGMSEGRELDIPAVSGAVFFDGHLEAQSEPTPATKGFLNRLLGGPAS